MSIFEYASSVLTEYQNYVKSFFNLADERIRELVERELFANEALWPEALIQPNPPYAPGASVGELCCQGKLHPACVDIFCHGEGRPFTLYYHQEVAIQWALRREPSVVTSGTGSGKTVFDAVFDELHTYRGRQGPDVALLIRRLRQRCGNPLDRRPEAGRPRLALHSLVQEYLNRTGHLWGMVINGFTLRLLRQTARLTRPTYIEFNLRVMLSGKNFADFSLFCRGPLWPAPRRPAGGRAPGRPEDREGIFPGVHKSYKFCLLSLKGADERKASACFAFFLTRTEHLRDARRVFALDRDDFAPLNPNTRTCPVFRTREDAELTKKIYRRVLVLVGEGEKAA